MSQTITLIGLASKKEFILTYQLYDLNKTLFEFLKDHEIPIASSCSGKGICEKCNAFTSLKEILTCTVYLRDFIKTDRIISVSYL